MDEPHSDLAEKPEAVGRVAKHKLVLELFRALEVNSFCKLEADAAVGSWSVEPGEGGRIFVALSTIFKMLSFLLVKFL